MRTFAGIDPVYSDKEKSDIFLLSIPYDGTSTWGKGADRGFQAFLEASENMELYDIETDSEVFTKGIHILDPVKENSDPEAMFNAVYKRTQELLGSEKFLTFFGGEHSISIGIIKAFYERYPDLTVLQLDAHTDLRPTYQGSPYNHACALYDASLHTNLIQVGIRSMDALELPYLNRKNCFFAQDIHGREDWIGEVLNLINGPVYITLDIAVIYDKNLMECSAYAAVLSDLLNEDVWLAQYSETEVGKTVRSFDFGIT